MNTPLQPKVNPVSGQCSFYVQRKMRFCKMRTKGDSLYCGEHLFMENADDRIPCPCDPKHTVDPRKLDEHLKKCNSRPKPLPVYFSLNTNSNSNAEISDLQRIDRTWPELMDFVSINSSITSRSNFLPQDLDTLKTTHISESNRHRIQNQKLSELILTCLTPNQSSVIVELGAGKGGLSRSLALDHMETSKEHSFILIDRKNTRGKADNFIRNMGTQCQRVFIDLKDLILDNLIPIDCNSVVFIGKHLCGVATCYSLTAIESLLLSRPKLNISIVIATCCHQICSYQSFYCNDDLKTFTIQDFSKICKGSSWSVCKTKIPTDIEINPQQFGALAKKFIDNQRILRLQRLEFNVDFIEYVPSQITLENKAIVAHKYCC